MLDASALPGIRPFVAMPNHGGMIATACVQGLIGLVNLAWTHGFPMQTRFLDGDSLVPRARNRLVAEFMADPRWTHLFWIDADVGFEPDAVLRLLLAGRDVVAGVYPMKSADPRFPVNLLDGHRTPDADGYLEVQDAPTGFMLIARGVFERLAAAMPALRYTPDDVPGSSAAASWPHHRFFDVHAEAGNGAYLSEDFAFCRRWREIGGQVFVDTRSSFSHHGPAAWRGRFGDWLGEPELHPLHPRA